MQYPSNFFSIWKAVIVAHAGILTREIPARNVQIMFAIRAPHQVAQVLHTTHWADFDSSYYLAVNK